MGRYGPARRHLMAVVLGVGLASASVAAAHATAPITVDYQLDSPTPGASRNDDGVWVVPAGQRIEWTVTWTLYNRSGQSLNDVGAVNHYSAEIDVDPRSVVASRGEVLVEPVGGRRSATAVVWDVGTMRPGETATMVLKIATGTNPRGKQMYGEPGNYALDSGLTVRWRKGSLSLPCVGVKAVARGWLRVEVSGTRIDWRIRKPGEYAALAFRAIVSSNQDVTFYFREFGELLPAASSRGDAPGIPVFYAIGDSLDQAASAGWLAADQLNGLQVRLGRSEALEEGIAWSLWQRLRIGPEVGPAAYVNEASVVFVPANVREFVADGS
ncbi:MAG: hypothetical protein IMX02_03640 [Limnochordaceae bacterium]|nr:hypothetical protein [Limnochordaceae bacterium]